MNAPFGFGAIRSEADYRDAYVVGAAVPTHTFDIPEEYQTQLDTPMMQGKIPACVSHSIADLMKLYWFKRTGKWIDFSPRYLDILSAQSDIPMDGGRRPRVVLKVATDVGCCTTKTLPNDVSLPIEQYRDPKAITGEADEEAYQYRIPGYVQIEVSKTREGVYLYGAVSSLFLIGEELWTPSWDDADIDPLRTPQAIIGGHQMTPFGWTKDLNHLQNEWGTAWADGGRNKYDQQMWARYIPEQWAIAQIPRDLKDFLKHLPSPSEFHYNFKKNMARGDFSEDVKFAQIALMILGFMKPVPPDELGHYGQKTADAVFAFQKSSGILYPSANNIGPLTRKQLNNSFW